MEMIKPEICESVPKILEVKSKRKEILEVILAITRKFTRSTNV